MEKNPSSKITGVIKKALGIAAVTALPVIAGAKGIEAKTVEKDATPAPIHAPARPRINQTLDTGAVFTNAAEARKIQLQKLAIEEMESHDDAYADLIEQFVGVAHSSAHHLESEGHGKEGTRFDAAATGLVKNIEKALDQFAKENPGVDLTKHLAQINDVLLNFNNPITGASQEEIYNILNHMSIASVQVHGTKVELGGNNSVATTTSHNVTAVQYFNTVDKKLIASYAALLAARDRVTALGLNPNDYNKDLKDDGDDKEDIKEVAMK